MKPIYDVIAKIPGSTFPDDWVIRGNHHDAWVNGAEDPISGIGRGARRSARRWASCSKHGWKPKRTIIYCAWDGEEPGLLGSTEWAEEHADELRAARRRLYQLRLAMAAVISASKARTRWKNSCNDVAHDIPRPGNQAHRLEAPPASRNRQRQNPRAARRNPQARAICALPRSVPVRTTPRFSSTLAWPRSTSASAAKTAAASITPSTTISTGTRTLATRTSFTGARWRRRAAPPCMRLADADLLPFEFGDFADTVQTYVNELKTAHTENAG